MGGKSFEAKGQVAMILWAKPVKTIKRLII
jgi:hypothetical protein